MTIDSKNIDQWLFNYYEGVLSPSEVKQLEAFLKRNPDYYEDANAWKDSFVEESVPAFNASFLVKEIDTKADRKRFALATLALLLIGSFSALYLASTNTNATDKNTTNAIVANNTITAKNEFKTTNKITKKNSTHKTITTKASLPNSNKVNQPVVNRNLTNNTVINSTTNSVNTNANLVVRNSLLNTTIHRNNATNLNQASYVAPINNINAIQLVGQTNSINSTIQPVENTIVNAGSTILNSVSIDNINLENNNLSGINSTNFIPVELEGSNELIVLNNSTDENINLTTAETKNNEIVKETNVTSDINPEKLMAAKKAEDLNKNSNEIAVNNNKKDITPENGIRFGNLRNVSLLQGINAEFQNNASFISQHYRTDGHAGVNYRILSSGEQSTNFVGGYSHLIRKYRTTIHGFGRYTSTNSYNSFGVGLQAALNLKLDRFNFLIPSISITYDKYTSSNSLTTNTNKSYFAQELTSQKLGNNSFSNANHVNVSTGLLYHHKKYYLGLAFNGLLQPKFTYKIDGSINEQTSTNYATVNFMAGTDFISKKYPEFSVSPQVLVEIRNMEPIATGGTVFKYKNWAAGAGISTKGALNTYVGFSHRSINLQYRFMADRIDATYGNLTGHYLTTHINIKGLSNKKKAILDEDK